PIVDPATGEVHMGEIFVAVLGASNYTYAEATFTQQLPDWIGAHVRMFRFFCGLPRLIVPDNLKSGVNKPSFYDPEINVATRRWRPITGLAFFRPGRVIHGIRRPSKPECALLKVTFSAECATGPSSPWLNAMRGSWNRLTA